MPLEPLVIMGQVLLVPMPMSANARDRYRSAEERIRRRDVNRRRIYYNGTQYQSENLDTLNAIGSGVGARKPGGDGDSPIDWGLVTGRLPEHMRKHEYSSAIAEAVDFLADELCASFDVTFADDALQQIYQDTAKISVALTGEGDGDEIMFDDVMRDAMQAGDIAFECVWDPVAKAVRWDAWESEQVAFEWNNDLSISRVIRSQVIWVEDTAASSGNNTPQVWKQVIEICVYEVVEHPGVKDDNGLPVKECRKQTFYNYAEEPDITEWLGISALPWQLLRIRKKLRAIRGEPLITRQIMAHVDRYNANEQLAYLISRYNSHGHLGIIGDQAFLQLNAENKAEGAASVSMDVADVLAFPGGTALQAITLPTNPAMIEHQRKELAEAIYKSFGLARVDPDTIAAFSSVSGYALEILNRRTAGTFRNIKRFWLRDIRTLIHLTLDCHAQWSGSMESDEPWWKIDPKAVYDDRTMELRMGSGYIVDHIIIRDDYAAQLISREEALRQDGKSDEEIKQIQDEITKEAEAALPPSITPPTPAFGAAPAGNGSQQGTKSGSTVSGGTLSGGK